MTDPREARIREALEASVPRVSWQVWCLCGLLRRVVEQDPGAYPVLPAPCRDCGDFAAVAKEQTTGGTVDRAHLLDALLLLDERTRERDTAHDSAIEAAAVVVETDADKHPSFIRSILRKRATRVRGLKRGGA